MALYLRNNVYWMELTVKGVRYRETTGMTDKELARQKMNVRRAELVMGITGSTNPTFAEAIDRWLGLNENKRSRKDDDRFAEFWKEQLGSVQLRHLKRGQLATKLEDKLKEGVSPNTVNRYQAFASVVLRAAVEWDWIEAAPVPKRLPVDPASKGRALTDAERERLLRELPLHQRHMFEFALETGLRQGAIKKLKWDDIDEDNAQLTVRVENSKSKREVNIALGDRALEILRERSDYNRLFKSDQGLVFTFEGKPIRNVHTAAWRKARHRAGLEGFRWHDSRHTWATNQARAGTPLLHLQAMGGWSNSTMVNRYAKMNVEAQRQYANNTRQSSIGKKRESQTM